MFSFITFFKITLYQVNQLITGSGIHHEQEQTSTPTQTKQKCRGNSNNSSFPTKEHKSVSSKDNVIVDGTFAEVVKSSAFVDKSMFIKDFVSGSIVKLITCPRRFGKSTVVNMLKTFLEIVVDVNGEVLDKKNTQNYKLFTEPAEKMLKIANEKHFIDYYLGKYPIILIDFSIVRSSSTSEMILARAAECLHQAFKRHMYLLKSSKLEKSEIESFAEYADGAFDDKKIRGGLKLLSKLLHKHFGTKVYILIDEYDAPVHCAVLHGLDIDKVHALVDGILLETLKSNDHLEQALITGVSAMMRASRSSSFDEYSLFEFLGNHKFAKYFGFTREEVLTLLNDFAIEDEKRKDVDFWCNGYLVKDQNSRMYNPWSIIMYLKHGKFDSYWIRSGAIEHILQLFKVDIVQEEIARLVQNEKVALSKLETAASTRDLQDLQKIINGSCKEMDVWQYDSFFTYIFELGCLSYSNEWSILKIPNNEINLEFKKVIPNFEEKEDQLQSQLKVDQFLSKLEQFQSPD